MFACNLCERKFSTQPSLNSHRAWHTGKLKKWKDAANAKPITSPSMWRKKGPALVREFLEPIFGENDRSVQALAKKICDLIEKKFE